MKAIFILRGAQSTGKTTTLLSLIEAFEKYGRYKTIICDSHPNENDKFYVASSDKGSVAVITAGDPGEAEMVEDCLRRSSDAQVIIAASRTRGSVYDILNDFASTEGYTVVDITPVYAYIDDESIAALLHKTQTESLFAMVNSLLDI